MSKLKAYLELEADWIACRDTDPKRADELDHQILKLWLLLSDDELEQLNARVQESLPP